ncbi:cytochrome p450 cyp749a22 [Quercus suber]|uniref:Cytochrome p450 cyp749a22 n=1 Tax=Quercus suber TaxID=58331 RepID=A0AAW0M7Q0_QUESU
MAFGDFTGLTMQSPGNNRQARKGNINHNNKEKIGAVEILVISLTSSLCLYFLLTLIWGLHKLWWTPIHIKNQLSSQEKKGPSYRFFHGSTKEIFNMIKEAMSRPMNLSHDIFPTILPHVHSWVDKYGK